MNADYTEILRVIHAKMRKQQRDAIRRIFGELSPEGIDHLATTIGSESSIEALVERHGDGGEFCVIQTEGVRRLAWVPYENNPSFGLIRILEHDPDSARYPHAILEQEFNKLISEEESE